jgi:hypothetical protein
VPNEVPSHSSPGSAIPLPHAGSLLQVQSASHPGVGVRVRVGRRRREDFAAVLREVLADEALRRRAAESGVRFAAERDGAESGADAVEARVGRS